MLKTSLCLHHWRWNSLQLQLPLMNYFRKFQTKWFSCFTKLDYWFSCFTKLDYRKKIPFFSQWFWAPLIWNCCVLSKSIWYIQEHAFQTYRHIYTIYNQDLCVVHRDFLDFSWQTPWWLLLRLQEKLHRTVLILAVLQIGRLDFAVFLLLLQCYRAFFFFITQNYTGIPSEFHWKTHMIFSLWSLLYWHKSRIILLK